MENASKSLITLFACRKRYLIPVIKEESGPKAFGLPRLGFAFTIIEMKKQYIFAVLLAMLIVRTAEAQNKTDYRWWNPATSDFPVIQGQGWPKHVAGFYDRLPAKAEQQVNNPSVWKMSQCAAGLTLRFYSNAPTIRVRYAVSRTLSRAHIPATGKSGLDLYTIDRNGQWEWISGKFPGTFGDTIEYQFNALKGDREKEYCLYLPYYNQVTWLEIGVPKAAKMEPVRQSADKPIVVYGTSIAQGTAAPRPGLTWTAILSRRLHTPLINLGFAGCGRLEEPIINLMTELDAKLYVLACLPNLVGRTAVIKTRLINAVKRLQEKRPEVPILIVDHANGNIRSLYTRQYEKFKKTNEASREAFERLKSEGVKNIYYLTADAIGLTAGGLATDGVHPNAVGEAVYARAYEKRIRRILNEPIGRYTTMQPCRQYRDRTYDWNQRHRTLLEASKTDPPKIVLLGNSIVQHWGGEWDETIHRGTDAWEKYFAPSGVRNFGFGSDRIENVLWRVYHGALDGYTAKQVIVMIGTNNLDVNDDVEILAGLRSLYKAIKERQPAAKLLMVGLLPRKGKEQRVRALNKQIAWLCTNENIPYINPGLLLLDPSGKINTAFFTRGGLHPGTEGYQILAKAMAPHLFSGKK